MRILLFTFILLFLASCTQEKNTTQKAVELTSEDNKTVAINSIKDLQNLFSDYNYTISSWEKGKREVPRIYFSKISKDWKTTSNKLPVNEKKYIFFQLLLPLVLLSNEDILKERSALFSQDVKSKATLKLALKYKVIKKETKELTQKQFNELKKRIDIIPASLALAQGAEESGWGTSRFASEGNALFGQWDFSGKGMRPTHQRKELGDYGLARFDTPLDSVKGYMLNLNTTRAYEKLRNVRKDLRVKNEKITGLELAKTLDKYSERGELYIKGLLNMISFNKLEGTDNAYLAKGDALYLEKGNE